MQVYIKYGCKIFEQVNPPLYIYQSYYWPHCLCQITRDEEIFQPKTCFSHAILSFYKLFHLLLLWSYRWIHKCTTNTRQSRNPEAVRCAVGGEVPTWEWNASSVGLCRRQASWSQQLYTAPHWNPDTCKFSENIIFIATLCVNRKKLPLGSAFFFGAAEGILDILAQITFLYLNSGWFLSMLQNSGLSVA